MRSIRGKDSGGIAHDFNNKLAGMTGNIYLDRKLTGQIPDVSEKLGNIEYLSRRAAEMIQRLLTFARKDRVSMKDLPLVPFIKEVLKFLRPALPENIALHEDICTDPLLCIFDVVMPAMSGDQAVKRIRQIRPDIHIIFSTGYDKTLQIGVSKEIVLCKPFSIVEMSHVIRQQLDG